MFGNNADPAVSDRFQEEVGKTFCFGFREIHSPVLAGIVPEGGDVVESECESDPVAAVDLFWVNDRIEFQFSFFDQRNGDFDIASFLVSMDVFDGEHSIIDGVLRSVCGGIDPPLFESVRRIEIFLEDDLFRCESGKGCQC
jgi:hypothetical protein